MNLRPQINRAASVLLVAVLSLCFHFSAAQARKDSPPDSGKKQDFLAQARAQFAHGDLQAAETSLWNVLNANPDQEQALLLLATIRGRQQRYPEAEALF